VRKKLTEAGLEIQLGNIFFGRYTDLAVSPKKPQFALAAKSSPQIRKKVAKKSKLTFNNTSAGIAWASIFAIVVPWSCLSTALGVFLHRKESLNFYQLWEVSYEIF